MFNIWSQISSDYVDEEEAIVHIDAWLTPDDNENGVVIAFVHLKTSDVVYIDERAKTDKYAQETIRNAFDDHGYYFNDLI